MKYKLRKFNLRHDIQYITDVFINNSDRYLFFPPLHINSDYDFEKWFMNMINTSIHDFYIIEIDYQAVGFIYAYKFSLIDRHCDICLYVDKEYRNLGVGAMATIKFLNELFSVYPLDMVYSSVYGYNQDSYQNHINAHFSLEATLKNYHYFNGKFYDYYIFSLSREAFYRYLFPFLK